MKRLLCSCWLMVSVISVSAQTPAGGLPDRLVLLRGNFERALERSAAPVRAQYRDELIKLKTEYSQAGKLSEALAVDKELKELFPPPAPAVRGAGLSGAAPAMAKVDVKNSEIARLVKNEKLYTGGEYYWVAIPEDYAGMRFAQPSHKHVAVTQFEVKTDGLVYAAFPSRWQDEDQNKNDDIVSRGDLERAGWKIVPAKANLVSNESGMEWIVCARTCKAGESFSLRVDKYCAPLVMMK